MYSLVLRIYVENTSNYCSLLYFIAVFIKLLFGKRHNNHFVGFWYERYELAWVFIGIPNF